MRILLRRGLLIAAGTIALCAASGGFDVLSARALRSAGEPGVQALFGLHHPDAAPFPSDAFTVADPAHVTGRRVDLPYPDCTVRVSDCQDLDVINTLDGFSLQTRLSMPFDGAIDPATVTSATVFLIDLGSTLDRGRSVFRTTVGINQIVWDTATSTLHAESNELLDQHTRYALIVTSGVRDAEGRPVEAAAAFRAFRQTTRHDYKQALLEAIEAARALGVPEREVVAASVFTTQSVTPVMERIRDQIKSTIPAPASFRVGPGGEPAIFDRASVAGITWRPQTAVSPPSSTTIALDLASLDVVPGAVGTIAFGTFVSPDYLASGGYMPAVGTRYALPPVQGEQDISFTLFLPAGARPAAGWPVAIVGAPTVRHVPMVAMAATLASRGIATIGIHTAGCGFGPLGTLTIALSDGASVVIPDRGRSHDQNGDNVIGATEGSVAAAPRAWTIGERDGYRQTAIDLMQLVRVIEVGMDVDDDGVPDLDAGRIAHVGFSAGAMHGTMFLALEPRVIVAVENSAGGMVPEHARWSPVRRPAIGASLQSRTPSLLNAPGLTTVSGVAVGGPHFDENKPLRDAPPVTNTLDGAMEIQKAFEIQEWGQQSGQSPIVWAPYLRRRPLTGVPAKSVIYHFSRGDQQANNPGTAALLRAGELGPWSVQYRHDLAFSEDPGMPKNPHQVVISPLHANPTFRAISRGMQDQIAAFIASQGSLIVHPEPARFFEVPAAAADLEQLHYIP